MSGPLIEPPLTPLLTSLPPTLNPQPNPQPPNPQPGPQTTNPQPPQPPLLKADEGGRDLKGSREAVVQDQRVGRGHWWVLWEMGRQAVALLSLLFVDSYLG